MKSFEDINHMLDSVEGGKTSDAMFDFSTEVESEGTSCTADCRRNCTSPAMGQLLGTVKGIILPDLPNKP